jgi:hypothetical protein
MDLLSEGSDGFSCEVVFAKGLCNCPGFSDDAAPTVGFDSEDPDEDERILESSFFASSSGFAANPSV